MRPCVSHRSGHRGSGGETRKLGAECRAGGGEGAAQKERRCGGQIAILQQTLQVLEGTSAKILIGGGGGGWKPRGMLGERSVRVGEGTSTKIKRQNKI